MRNVLLGLVGLFVILVAIGVAVGGSHNTASSTSVSSSPAASTPAKQAVAPSPSATHVVAFQPQTLLATSGGGDNTAARFSVGGSGDWDIYWTYSGGFGQSVNFAIDADNGNDLNFNGPNQLGTGGIRGHVRVTGWRVRPGDASRGGLYGPGVAVRRALAVHRVLAWISAAASSGGRYRTPARHRRRSAPRW